MTTDFDLAERAGVSVDAVRKWLRHRGYGGKRAQRIPPAIEQAFLEAHGVGRGRIEDLPRRGPARPQPARVTRPIDRPAARATAPSVIDREKSRRINDLQRELTSARADLQAAQAELARRPVTRPIPQISVPPPEPPAADDAPALRDVLARQGLTAAGDARAALEAALADDPEALLDALLVADPAVFERVQPICPAVTCRTVADLLSWHVIPAGASRCAVCRGSDNRRWYRLMALRLERAGRHRLLVVGGSPKSHTELARLKRDAPRLDVRLVEGDQRLDGNKARALVGGVDAVVFWASTVLDHAVSDVIKEAARRDPRVIRAVSTPGARGVAAMCRAVIEAVEQQARG